MSLSSSRRSSKMREDGEFYLECKAAFLTEYDDINDKIESRNKLVSLLQTTGRNPTRATLNKYWSSSTSSMSFNDFVDICNKEPVTTADDLMKAFRRIDINGDGYISFDELYKIMNKKGESMSRDEVRRMIDEVDDNKDGRLDYREFTNMVMKTTEDSKKMSKKMMERKERKKKRGELSETSDRRGSASSQRSQTSKQEELLVQSATQNQLNTWNQTTKTSKSSGPSMSETGTSLTNEQGKTSVNMSTKAGNIKSEKSEISTSFARTEISRNITKENSKDSTLSKSERPKKMDSGMSPVIRTPRSRLAIPSIKELERPGTSYRRRETSESEKSVKNPEMTMSEIHQDGLNNMANTLAQDSARSVGEELDYDDDHDIMSTGRPTPRVSLSSRTDISKADSPKSARNGLPKQEENAKRGEKGKMLDKCTANEAAISTLHDGIGKYSGDGKRESGTQKKNSNVKTKEMETSIAESKETEAGSAKGNVADARNGANEQGKMENTKDRNKNIENGEDSYGSSKNREAMKEKVDKKQELTEKTVKEKSARSEQPKEEPEIPNSLVGLMDIFKANTQDKMTPRWMFDYGVSLNVQNNEMSRSQTEKKPPTGKENGNQLTAKKDEEKAIETENKFARSTRSANDTETGSQSSLRSGDKEAGVPVPSPRKSVKGVTEDEVPRPSPRVRNSKTKSPSSSLRSKEKLPDPRSLQDWKNFTSKGCFFYEEDEIVSHVYSLRLQDDSTVYLSAAPINEPACLNLPGSEPIDTALFVLDSKGNVVAFTEQRDVQGTFGVKVDLEAGDYQIVPYTTGCRFKHRSEMSLHMKEARLVKKDKDDKILITTAFRKALEDIFELCDLDGNGTMSRDEFNWFNVRTSGEELGDDEWDVVEEKTDLENGEITRAGFIKLNEMEAEDAEGDVEDLWITLTSMGMNKSLMMDEACPYRLNVYVKDVRRKQPRLTVTGIESLEKKEFVSGICQFLIEKAGEPTSIRKMKDLYLYTYKNDYSATMVIDNRSRSTVQLEIDCSKSRNVVSNRSGLDHTFEIDPQQTAIAHHLMPKSELSDWSVVSTETIHK